MAVQWRTGGGTVQVPRPIFTWDDPGSDVDQVTVRFYASPEPAHDEPPVAEYCFFCGDEPEPAPNRVVHPFTANAPPTSLILPPGLLAVGQHAYWSVAVRRGGHEVITGSPSDEQHIDFEAYPRPTNKFGVGVYQYYSQKGPAPDDWKDHLDWASDLVGPGGGWVKLFFPWIGDDDAPVERYAEVLGEVYRRGLTPIVRVQGTSVGSGRSAGWARPPQDDPDNYDTLAGSYERYAETVSGFLCDMPAPPGGPLYVELWNEMNYGGIEWKDPATGTGPDGGEPENYARFFLAVRNRLLDRGAPVVLMNGGLGRLGYEPFLRRMVDEFRRLGADPTELLEHYADHNYPRLDQLDRQISDGEFWRSPFQYKHELSILAAAGVDVSRLRVYITEAGFLGAGRQADPEAQMALTLQLIEAWAPEEQVVAATFFTLDDYTDPLLFPGISEPLGQEGLTWVRAPWESHDGRPLAPNPVYDAAREQFRACHSVD